MTSPSALTKYLPNLYDPLWPSVRSSVTLRFITDGEKIDKEVIKRYSKIFLFIFFLSTFHIFRINYLRYALLLLQESPILQQEIRDVLTAAMPSHPNISHVRSPFRSFRVSPTVSSLGQTLARIRAKSTRWGNRCIFAFSSIIICEKWRLKTGKFDWYFSWKVYIW